VTRTFAAVSSSGASRSQPARDHSIIALASSANALKSRARPKQLPSLEIVRSQSCDVVPAMHVARSRLIFAAFLKMQRDDTVGFLRIETFIVGC